MCGMTQYNIRSKRSAIRAQAVYFLHSTMLSVTCLRLSYVSVFCRVTYLQFPIQSTFLNISVARSHQHCGILFVLMCNIGHRTLPKNLGRYVSCTERTSQGKDFELILTVKMKTIHPVEGQFGSEFPTICNHCGVMAA